MSVTFRFLAGSFILSLMLTVIAASPSWAEPMAIVMIDPQIDTVGESPFRGEQPRSITLIRVGPRVGLGGKSPFGKDQKEDFQQSDIAAVFAFHGDGSREPPA